MFCNSYTVPSTAISVSDLIYNDVSETYQDIINSGVIIGDLIIQANEANTSKLYFGDEIEQAIYLNAGSSSGFFKINLNKLFIRGNDIDSINIFLT